MKLCKLVIEYEEHQKRMKTLAATTLKNYLTLIREFVKWSDAQNEGIESVVSDLNPTLFCRYMDHIAARVPKKAQIVRAATRSFCKYLMYLKWIERDITLEVEMPVVERSQRQGPPEDAIDRMLAAIETMQVTEHRRQVYKAVMCLLVFAGLRKKEIFDLRVQDIRLGDREIFVRFGKGNEERIVKAPDEFWPVITAYLSHRPAYPGDNLLVYGPRTAAGLCCATSVLQQVMIAAGLEGAPITPHCLRHAFATRAANNNAPLTVIQAQLGHSKITTTELYIHAPKRITEIQARYFGKSVPDPAPGPKPVAPVHELRKDDAAEKTKRRRIALGH